MKKIILAVCGGAFALSLNAANFVWGFDGAGNGDIYKAGTTDYLETGTAFLFLGTVTANTSAFDVSTATLITTGGFDDTYYAFGNVDASSPSSSDLVTANSTRVGQAYTLVLVDQGGLTSLVGYEGNYYLASGTSTIQAIPGATTTYYANFVNGDTISGTNWSTMSAVPEPTSGLLLLLGVAGLALKRKHA